MCIFIRTKLDLVFMCAQCLGYGLNRTVYSRQNRAIANLYRVSCECSGLCVTVFICLKKKKNGEKNTSSNANGKIGSVTDKLFKNERNSYLFYF